MRRNFGFILDERASKPSPAVRMFSRRVSVMIWMDLWASKLNGSCGSICVGVAHFSQVAHKSCRLCLEVRSSDGVAHWLQTIVNTAVNSSMPKVFIVLWQRANYVEPSLFGLGWGRISNVATRPVWALWKAKVTKRLKKTTLKIWKYSTRTRVMGGMFLSWMERAKTMRQSQTWLWGMLTRLDSCSIWIAAIFLAFLQIFVEVSQNKAQGNRNRKTAISWENVLHIQEVLKTEAKTRPTSFY